MIFTFTCFCSSSPSVLKSDDSSDFVIVEHQAAGHREALLRDRKSGNLLKKVEEGKSVC